MYKKDLYVSRSTRWYHPGENRRKARPPTDHAQPMSLVFLDQAEVLSAVEKYGHLKVRD